MNLNHLYYFKILAQTENYTEAAKILRISQPSLSYAIKNLEASLDFPLFEKRGRNVYLTDYGQTLHKTSIELFQLLDSSISTIKKTRASEINTVRVGLIPTLASTFFPNIIRQGKLNGTLTQNYELFQGYTNQIIDNLKNEVVDIGICSKTDCPEVLFIPINKQPFALAFNPDLFKNSHEISQTWHQLPLVTYRPELPIGKAVRDVISQYTDHPQFEETFDDETFIGGYVCVNPCIAIVANTPFLKQFNLQSIVLDEQNLYHISYLAYLKKNESLPKIKKITELIIASSDFPTIKKVP